MKTATAENIVVDHYPAARRSLRIAYVTETYPPEVNGVAMSTARIVEGLHRRNHDVQLIRPRQDADGGAGRGTHFDEVLVRGLPIPRYPNLRMGVPSKRALVRLWSRHRPDVVHVATEGPLCWSALQAAQHLMLPVSSDFRTNFHVYSQHYGVGWLQKPIMAYLRKFHNRTLCTMVPTDALRRELGAAGFLHLRTVSRGVDTALFMPERRSEALRAEWGAAPDDLVVACVGRLAHEKNLGVLINAFEAIAQVRPRARLVLVGDGPIRAELQSRCPRAIFAGQRTGADLAAHYASADLFLFPSETETFGNVTTEALASGLPSVAFNYAAAAQLIRDGDNGLLVPLGDNAGFVRRALELASMLSDPARRDTLRRQARASTDDLGWDAIVARFEAVLASVIDQVPAPAQPALAAPARPAM